MATYGVSYGGTRSPRGYGVSGRTRSLQSLYAGQRPPPSPAFNPISDTLSSLQAANQGRLNTINQPTGDPAAAFRLANAPSAAPPAPQSTADAAAAWRLANPSTPAPPGASGGSTTDLSADPILTQIKALGQRGVQDAASQGLAGAKNDLINYGSVNVPQSLRDLFTNATPSTDPIVGDLPGNPVLGALGDANTATAATGNPYSILAQLGQAHEGNVHGIDQATNLANLYYSSTHANQLGQENQNYLGSQNTAAQNLASLLSGENTGFLSALGGAHNQYLTELPNAYARALAAGSGDPTVTPPPTDPGGGANVDPNQPTMTTNYGTPDAASHAVHPYENPVGGYLPPNSAMTLLRLLKGGAGRNA